MELAYCPDPWPMSLRLVCCCMCFGPYTVNLTSLRSTGQMHSLVDTIYLKVCVNVASKNPARMTHEHEALRNLLRRFITNKTSCLHRQDGPCAWAENVPNSFHCDTVLGVSEQMSTHPDRDSTTGQSDKHHQTPTWWTNDFVGVLGAQVTQRHHRKPTLAGVTAHKC